MTDPAMVEQVEKIKGQHNQPPHKHESILFMVKAFFKTPVSLSDEIFSIEKVNQWLR